MYILRTTILFLSILNLVNVQAQVFPNPATLSTGQGTAGSNDPIWTVSGWYASNPPNPIGLTYEPALINNNCAPGAWVNPAALPPPVNNGNWITGQGEDCSNNYNAGYVYFRLTLNLPADCNGNSVATSGNYTLYLSGYADNTITDVFVNGTSTGINGGNFSSPLNITLTGPWVPGVNYVDVQVYNFPNGGNANPYGLLLVANSAASSAADGDGDGVPDISDLCPCEAGTLSNGCSPPPSPPVLTVSGNNLYCSGNACQSIAPNLTISDPDNAGLDGAKVYFNSGYTNGEDILQFTPQYGITGSFNSATGVLTLTGNATAQQYQEVLRNVCYSNSNNSPTSGQREIYIVLGNLLYNSGNGHYYHLVNNGNNITWTDARNAASSSTYFGMQGYLVTITSQQESNFISQLIQAYTWTGGSDESQEGVWRWVTGCEGLENGGLGRHFFSDASTSCNGPGGTVVGSNFNNWDSAQPDNCGCGSGEEDYLHLYPTGVWNDFPNGSSGGCNINVSYHIVEYGCMPNDPALNIQGSVTVTPYPSTTSTTQLNICDTGTYTRPSGIVVNTSGTYIDTLQTANGCDSIITTQLTVIDCTPDIDCNLICNTDFETEQVAPVNNWTLANQANISCWSTTASDGMIEFWYSGFSGVPAYSGNQFIELNANMVSTLYQDFLALPGSTVDISFAHRGRSGIDVMSVSIGPPGGPYTTLGTFSTDNTAWQYYTVNYTFPSIAQVSYSLQFNSISAAGGSQAAGNFLDAISITMPEIVVNNTVTNPMCPTSTDGSINVNTTGGTSPYTIAWNAPLSGAGFNVNGLPVGEYSYTVTDLYGCEYQDTLTLVSFPDTSVSQNITICYNETFTRPGGAIVNTTGIYIDTLQTIHGCDSIITTNLSVTPNSLVATGDVAICLGDSTPLSATGGLAYFWSPSASLSDSNSANPIAFPTSTTPYIVRSGQRGQNLLNNGDFEQGNTGFSSTYQYTAPPNTNEGQYFVGTNAQNWNGGMAACGDHTSGTGNMLLVNGSVTPNSSIWCQSINVVPNQDYAFSTWVATLTTGNLALLQFSINSSLLEQPFQAASTTCDWQEFYTVWNSGISTSANICIVNQNTNAGANDFALDDISFAPLCTVYDTVTIVVNQPAFTTQNPVICDNETYTRPSGIVVNTAGTYVDTLTTVNGCDSIITSNLTVNPTFALTLNPVICANESYTRPSGIVVNTAGTYIDVLTTVNGCDSVITTQLSVNPIYQVSVSDTICSYQNYTRPSGIVVNSSGTYIDTLNTVNGCDSVITTSLTVINLTLSHTSVDVLCNGENTGSISVSQSGGLLPVSYSWNNVSLSGNTPSNIPAGSYSVTATDAFGCTANDAMVINEPTLLVFSAAFTEPLCHGETNGTISIVPQGGVPPYQFSLNNQLSDSGFFVNLSAGSYSLVVTDSHNCSEQSNLVVTEPDLLEIYYQPTVLTMYLGQQIDLDLSTNYNSNISFSWEPPTGLSCSDCSSPVMKPNVTTNYVLTVTANPHGKDCVYEFPFTVTVFPERTFYIPNAFSPNGDNSNDEFRIFFKEKSAVKQLFIKIFNRWGEKVFEANEADFAWDGKFKEQYLSPGTYVYQLDIVFMDNTTQQSRGSITILR